jgi:GTPase Era involved in 16S rRNA processing
MTIQLFEKKYRKTKDHDGTVEIELCHLTQSYLFNEVAGKAYSVKTTYVRDQNGQTIGEEKTRTLNLKAIKKELPQCVKVKINDLYIKL